MILKDYQKITNFLVSNDWNYSEIKNSFHKYGFHVYKKNSLKITVFFGTSDVDESIVKQIYFIRNYKESLIYCYGFYLDFINIILAIKERSTQNSFEEYYDKEKDV